MDDSPQQVARGYTRSDHSLLSGEALCSADVENKGHCFLQLFFVAAVVHSGQARGSGGPGLPF